ncbi:hypothetical protein LEP1GSC008_3411 [Leptospira kirschneri serovar Bulgarica str. Nikolaevo]|uniref:Uncharacterized protein n=1 Tax=Leptospira kirschneri serovar Bulgarica str. Nikolaevo TaxID=1240687 RepID=M6F533_9LEPT|nr:hypothetical protein LEP1GSC008_3411 [Leptospira kirschneri serovar Bulgarica str. Nikolaevo]
MLKICFQIQNEIILNQTIFWIRKLNHKTHLEKPHPNVTIPIC